MTWTVQLMHDGTPLVEAPVDDWIAAQVCAEVTVALWGGPVSVVDAVATQRAIQAAEDADPTIFDVLGAA